MARNQVKKEAGENEETLQAEEISQPDIEEQVGQEGVDPSEEQPPISDEAIEEGGAPVEGEETQQAPIDEPAGVVLEAPEFAKSIECEWVAEIEPGLAESFPSDAFLKANGLNRSQVFAVSPGTGAFRGRMGLVTTDGRKFYE